MTEDQVKGRRPLWRYRARGANVNVKFLFAAGRVEATVANLSQHGPLLGSQSKPAFGPTNFLVRASRLPAVDAAKVSRSVWSVAMRRKGQLAFTGATLALGALGIWITYVTVKWPPSPPGSDHLYHFYVPGFCFAEAFAFVLTALWAMRELQQYESLLDQRSALLSRMSSIEDDLSEVTEFLQQAHETHLFLLSRRLGFGLNERISVYRHDPDGRFRLTGRYSKNDEYKVPGRASYPSNEGCIGRAWAKNDGWSCEPTLPPKADREAWLAKMAEYEIPADIADLFIMPMRSIAAVRIDSAIGEKRIGVIVFESTESNRIKAEELLETVREETTRFQLLLQQRPLTKSTDAAAQRGF